MQKKASNSFDKSAVFCISVKNGRERKPRKIRQEPEKDVLRAYLSNMVLLSMNQRQLNGKMSDYFVGNAFRSLTMTERYVEWYLPTAYTNSFPQGTVFLVLGSTQCAVPK